MTMLIVSVVLTTALSAMRIVISSIGATSTMSDLIMADEAAKGGVEWGLMRYKYNDRNNNTTAPCVNGQYFNLNPINLCTSLSTNNRLDASFSGFEIISDATVGKVTKRHIYQMYPY